jgi:hypothetical protein
MRCLGLTKKRRRCRNEASYLFCRQHRLQPVAWFFLISTVLGLYAGLFQDLIRPLWERSRLQAPEEMLALATILADGSLDPTGVPYLAAAQTPGGTLPTLQDLLTLDGWKAYISDTTGLAALEDMRDPENFTLPEIADDPIFPAYAPAMVPGILVFTLQNVAPSDGPGVTLRALSLAGTVEPLMPLEATDTLVLVHRHVAYFAERVPADRGTAMLRPGQVNTRVSFDEEAEPFATLFQERMAPGDAVLFTVDLDIANPGQYRVSLDLVVDLDLVTPSGLRRERVVLDGLLEQRVIRPHAGQLAISYFTETGGGGFQIMRPPMPDADVFRAIEFLGGEVVEIEVGR